MKFKIIITAFMLTPAIPAAADFVTNARAYELALSDLTVPANQKILADSLTFDDRVLFVAFSPDTNAAATCAGKGTNFLYRMHVVNGDPIVPNIDTLADSDADDARSAHALDPGWD